MQCLKLNAIVAAMKAKGKEVLYFVSSSCTHMRVN